jgi:hypothetical protein
MNDLLQFTSEVMNACICDIIYISSKSYDGEYVIRLKVSDKYIGCSADKIVKLYDHPLDDTILRYDCNKIKTNHGILSCCNNVLSILDDELFILNNLSSNIKFCYSNLINFVRDGIICKESKIDLQYASEIIHNTPHTRVSNLLEIDEIFWTILNDPDLHSFLKQIFTNGYHCTTYSSNTLKKDVDNTGWHCDYPYHTINYPYPKETLGVQVIWSLDDFTEENGATYFVKGSHKTCTWPSITYETPMHRMIMKKNNYVVYFGKLWHTQGINRTDLPRSALLANFSPLNIPVKDNISEQVKDKSRIIDDKLIFY